MQPSRQSAPSVLMSIPEAPGLFADALLTDESNDLLFLSLWGRDTAIQEFRARLSLSVRDGGLDNFRLEIPVGSRVFVQLGDPERLNSHSGRTSSQTVFGTLVHLWLYDRLAVEPDRSNRRAMLLYRENGEPPSTESWQQLQDKLWRQLRDICHLPLLPHWQKEITDAFRKEGWIRKLDGHGVSAYFLDLGGNEVESLVTRLIQNGRLMATE